MSKDDTAAAAWRGIGAAGPNEEKEKSTWGAFGGRIPPKKEIKAFITNKNVSFYRHSIILIAMKNYISRWKS
jgi:hypothetical protein